MLVYMFYSNLKFSSASVWKKTIVTYKSPVYGVITVLRCTRNLHQRKNIIQDEK